MFILLGAVCFFTKINCTSVGIVGHPYETKEKCMAVKRKMDAGIGAIEWINGEFECIEDQAVI